MIAKGGTYPKCGTRLAPAERINEAHERMLKGDVRYRFVIDVASLKGD